jgi:hypothetical protein
VLEILNEKTSIKNTRIFKLKFLHLKKSSDKSFLNGSEINSFVSPKWHHQQVRNTIKMYTKNKGFLLTYIFNSIACGGLEGVEIHLRAQIGF